MRYPLLLAALATAALAACADSTTGPTPMAGANAAGNPPPPAITGFVYGDFSADILDASAASLRPSLRLSGGSGVQMDPVPGGSTASHTFTSIGGELNANSSRSNEWLTFPRVAALPFLPSNDFRSVKAGILFGNGLTFGSGYLYDYDQTNGGYWVIDLTQYSQTGNALAGCPGAQPGDPCRLVPDVTAIFYKLVGFDQQQNPIYVPFTSAPAPLFFQQTFPIVDIGG